MDSRERNIDWPAAAVAVALILFVGSVTVAAILKYSTVDEALKIWGALSGIVGLLVGAVATYFFTQGTVKDAQEARVAAQENAKVNSQAFAVTAGELEREVFNNLVQTNPAVQKAVGK